MSKFYRNNKEDISNDLGMLDVLGISHVQTFFSLDVLAWVNCFNDLNSRNPDS